MNLDPQRRAPPQSPEDAALVIWFFDSSRQVLVYRDLEQKIVVGFTENDVVAQGWKMDGIRQSLPKAKLEGPK